ncbi:MAG: hypothetical protein ACI4Q9_04590 [Candidatus Methanomethylophilaceae archaeon]
MGGRSSVPLAIFIVMVLSAIPYLMSQDAMSSDQPVTVTFHDSDGEVCVSSEWMYRETPYFTGKEPVPPEGERFIGWNTVRGSSSAIVIPPAEHDTDYYPVFAGIGETSAITVDPNNGKDPIRTIYRMSGTDFAVPTVKEMGIDPPGSEGTFILDAWEDGSGERHTPGMTCTAEDGMCLRAVWIRAAAETPVVPEVPDTVEVGRFSETTLSYPCTGVTDGTVTYEWFLRDGGTSSCIGRERDLVLPHCVTCFPGTYIIFYIATCTDPYAVEHVSSSVSPDISVCVKDEYVFSISGTDVSAIVSPGENVRIPKEVNGRILKELATDGGVTIPIDGSYVMPSADVTAVPVWDETGYVIGLVSEGRTVGSIRSDGGTVSVPGCTEIREGYTFSGWLYDGAVFVESDVMIADGDMSLTAVWISDRTVCTVDGEEHIEDTVTLPEDGMLMWYDGSGRGYLPGETVKVTDGMSFTSVPL